MLSRRSLLAAAAAGSTLAGSRPFAPLMSAARTKSYSHAELEAKVKRRDFSGLTKRDLPTPNLVLDKDVFDKNLKTMANHCKKNDMDLRSHVKVHRSPEIGMLQIKSGALGLCCATISECEVMMDAGAPGILWTCQPVGPNKFSRIVALTKKDPSFMFVVEDPIIVDQLEELAAAEKVTFNVVVDNDVGIGRQGVMPGKEGLELSQRVMKAKHLRLAGLMGYSGAASHAKGWEHRWDVSNHEIDKLMESVHLCRNGGIPVDIVTGGSTGSYNIDSQRKDGLTELQAGSYALMDSNYSRIGSQGGSETYDDFGVALTVLTTVISKHYSKKVAIDAGNKSMTRPTDMVKGRPELRVRRAGAEYGRIEWDETDLEPKLGDQLDIVMSNLDMSVNCFDRMFVCKGDQVVDVYSVLGRTGPSQR
jgi:D-serine deaminase-like pyridoxal phosphate-dependent protein